MATDRIRHVRAKTVTVALTLAAACGASGDLGATAEGDRSEVVSPVATVLETYGFGRFEVVAEVDGNYTLRYYPTCDVFLKEDEEFQELEGSNGGFTQWVNFVFGEVCGEPNFSVVAFPAGEPIEILKGNASFVSEEAGAAVFEHGLDFREALKAEVSLTVRGVCLEGMLATEEGINYLDPC